MRPADVFGMPSYGGSAVPEPPEPPESPVPAPRRARVADERYGGSLAPATPAGGGSTFGGSGHGSSPSAAARPFTSPSGRLGAPPARSFGTFGSPPAPLGAPPSNPYAPPPGGPVGASPPSLYAPAPAGPFGAPPVAPPFGPGVAGVGAPPLAGWAPAQARPGLPRWAVALIVVGAGFVAVCVAAAVVIPVFLASRDRSVWRSTTFSLPATALGHGRISGPVVDQMSAKLALPWESYGLDTPQVGAYGTVGVPSAAAVIVVHARKPMSAGARSSFMTGAVAGLAASPPPHEVDPGRLGGDMRCSDQSSGPVSLTVCVSVDAAGAVAVAVVGMGNGDAAVAQARALREVVEHRS